MILSQRTAARLALRSWVRLADDGRIAQVIGTWAFTGLRGGASARRDKVGADPRLDEAASGYLLQPLEGGETIRAWWADGDIGSIVPIKGGHLRLVK